jgi:Flp pilus assembly protein TadB
VGTSLSILLLVLIAAVIGGALVLGAPVFALPIVFVVLGAMGAFWFVRRGRQAREMREFREQAKTESDFTARDQLTQT